VIYTVRLKRSFLALTVLLSIAGLGWRVLDPSPLRHAPDLTFSTLEGRQLRLDALRGRPVLINFWATSCASCVRELPHLAELYRELASRGLEIIGVAMPYDPPNRVVAMSRREAIPYPVALDIRGNALSAFGGVNLTPTSILVGPDGLILDRSTGALDMERLRARVLTLLSKDQLAQLRTAGD
jgi:thiol-disulfide isomerase/thioredoxin